MINAPWYTPEEDVIFTGYAAEIELRSEKLDRFIELLLILDDPNDEESQQIILNELDLTLENRDIEYIKRRIR